MPQERSWALYLDESGAFGDASDTVAVAGLLVDEAAGGPSATAIEHALKRMLPEFPWPLHATILRQPSYVALAASAGKSRRKKLDGGDGEFVRVAEEASTWLEAQDRSAVQTIQADLAARCQPSYELLDRLSRRLRREQPGWTRRLDARMREAWAYVRDAATKIAGPREQPCAYLVICSETQKGDAGVGEDDRYFEHLEVLLHRLRAVLAARGGKHFVSVRVLGRHVYEPRVSARRPLMLQDVERVIRASVSESDGPVRLRAEQVAKFEATVGVHFVLADFIANQARRVLADASASLAQAELRLVTQLGPPARSGSPSRPHLAATGVAQQYLSEPPHRRGPLDAGSGRRLWAVEQALEWASRG